MRASLVALCFFAFALVASAQVASQPQIDPQIKVLLQDLSQISSKLQEIIPTLDNGGAPALENLKTLLNIMKKLLPRLQEYKGKFPTDINDPITTLQTMISKCTELVEIRSKPEVAASLSTSEKAENKEEKKAEKKAEKKEEKKVEKAEKKLEKAEKKAEKKCKKGACCNTKKGILREKGEGCKLENKCHEPAAYVMVKLKLANQSPSLMVLFVVQIKLAIKVFAKLIRN